MPMRRLHSIAWKFPVMISALVPRAQIRMRAVADNPAIVRYLVTGGGRAEAQHFVDSAFSGRDSSLWRVELLDRAGEVRLENQFHPAKDWSDWAKRQIMRGAMSSTSFVYGPITDVNGRAQYQLLSAVHAPPPASSRAAPLGYFVETRTLSGSGVRAIM